MAGKRASWIGLLLLFVAGGLLGASVLFATRLNGDLRLPLALAIFAVTGFGVALGLHRNAPLVMRQILMWLGATLVAATALHFHMELLRAVGLESYFKVAAAEPPTDTPGLVALRAENSGHFFADALVNGTAIHFLVDTGATEVALTALDARRMGLPLEKLNYSIIVRTANGDAAAARVTLDSLIIGTIRVGQVSALVTRGGLDQSLLGMSFLKRLNTVTVDSDRLVMRQ